GWAAVAGGPGARGRRWRGRRLCSARVPTVLDGRHEPAVQHLASWSSPLMGSSVGAPISATVRSAIGAFIGTAISTSVGAPISTIVGTAIGTFIGSPVGTFIGAAISTTIGAAGGRAVGARHAGCGHVVVIDRHCCLLVEAAPVYGRPAPWSARGPCGQTA